MLVVGYYVVSLTKDAMNIRQIVTLCPPFASKKEAKRYAKEQMKRGVRTKLYILKAEVTK